MVVFHVPSFIGTLTLHEHSAFKWVNPEELSLFKFPAPDTPIIEFLQKPDWKSQLLP